MQVESKEVAAREGSRNQPERARATREGLGDSTHTQHTVVLAPHLVALKVVGGVVQLALARVALVAEQLHGHVGVGAGAAQVGGVHHNAVVADAVGRHLARLQLLLAGALEPVVAHHEVPLLETCREGGGGLEGHGREGGRRQAGGLGFRVLGVGRGAGKERARPAVAHVMQNTFARVWGQAGG